jgi:hypothetical protein
MENYGGRKCRLQNTAFSIREKAPPPVIAGLSLVIAKAKGCTCWIASCGDLPIARNDEGSAQ